MSSSSSSSSSSLSSSANTKTKWPEWKIDPLAAKEHVRAVAAAYAARASATTFSTLPAGGYSPLAQAVSVAFYDDWTARGGPGVWPPEQLRSFYARWGAVMKTLWYTEAVLADDAPTKNDELRGAIFFCASRAMEQAKVKPVQTTPPLVAASSSSSSSKGDPFAHDHLLHSALARIASLQPRKQADRKESL
jgi:hypothetical protein